MGKIVFALVCVSLLHVAFALNCYSCSGSECESGEKLWKKETCGTTSNVLSANQQRSCLKMSYKDKTTQKKMMKRDCIIAEIKDGKPFFNCSTNLGDSPKCSLCQTDYCNSVSKVTLSLAAISGVILAVLVPKFL